MDQEDRDDQADRPAEPKPVVRDFHFTSAQVAGIAQLQSQAFRSVLRGIDLNVHSRIVESYKNIVLPSTSALAAAQAAAQASWRLAIPDLKILGDAYAFTPRLDPKIFSGLSSAMESLYENVLGSHLQDLAARLHDISRALYPSNLRGITDLKYENVLAVLDDGIPLFIVPSQATAERLIAATDIQARRQIIGQRFDSIVADCDKALDTVTNSDLVYEVSAVRQAITVIRSGHFDAGQALAATVMDSLMWRWGDKNKDDYKVVTRKQRPRRGQTPRDIDDLVPWIYMVMAPVYIAHSTFHPAGGDPIPRVFNRHASLHRISYRQYSKRNCAIALMMATSLLAFMDRYE
ncbi:hypothetical protein [Knoellia subterranea]|uniref:Uncharacterized protein n=1 Tax=Knoellia subterranea KCTC 19937 TaxID=1385521 RepID=A0A0A0JVE2_9MICO|nr:hypothetical protein [Knoellia subterranea]KGN39601.1 hypothetical protein N803_02010 [Knoellia subterranea KCTC 19937]